MVTSSGAAGSDWLRQDGGRCLLEVFAAPRASRTRVIGLHDGRLKIQVAAPPVDDAANTELLRFLASQLALPRAAVALIRGAASRRKTVAVTGIDPETLSQRLGAP